MPRVLTTGSTQRMGDHNPPGRRMWGKGISGNEEEFSRWWEVGGVGRTGGMLNGRVERTLWGGAVDFCPKRPGKVSQSEWNQTEQRDFVRPRLGGRTFSAEEQQVQRQRGHS